MSITNIPREETMKRLAKAAEDQTLLLAAIAQGKPGIKPATWSDWQAVVRMGLADKLVAPGDQFSVYRVKDVTAKASGAGINGVGVDKIKFIKGRNEARPGAYGWEFDGAGWRENGQLVDPVAMGVTISGSPTKGDMVVLTETCTEDIFDVAGVDYDVPANVSLSHSISLLRHDCYTNCAFDQPELLWVCDKSVYPDGLPVGTYNFTFKNSTYGGGTQTDGTYQFTTKQVIPVGGGFRHTGVGGWQSSYSKADALGAKINTYTADGSLETGLVVTEGSGGTALGTFTARDSSVAGLPVINNFTERNRYGSNDYGLSAIRQWMNSDAGSGWWKKSNPFDRPQTSPASGFLYGLDPAFVAVLGAVRKRTKYNTNQGDPAYKDTEEMVFPVSMTEVGFGANEGVYETPVEPGGEPRRIPYPFYEGATDEDRIKYLDGSARGWWLRGASPGGAYIVRIVRAVGSLLYSNAGFTYGGVPGLCII